jgi:hypothetical protein
MERHDLENKNDIKVGQRLMEVGQIDGYLRNISIKVMGVKYIQKMCIKIHLIYIQNMVKNKVYLGFMYQINFRI